MVNMKISFDNQFVNLVGYPLTEKMDDTLANALALSTQGDPRKMINWALSLVNDGEIEVDKHDLIYLKNFIEIDATLTNLAKNQLLDRLDKGLNSINQDKIEG